MPYKYIATSVCSQWRQNFPDAHVTYLIQSFVEDGIDEVRMTLPAASLPLKRNMSMPTYSANAARNML